jgi:transcriptional regulator of acetoin/glycerol metabolism
MVARRILLAFNSHGKPIVTLVGQGAATQVAVGTGHGTSTAAHDDTAGGSSDVSERSHLLLAIEECGGNRALVARKLGISRSTLYRRMARLGLAAREG